MLKDTLRELRIDKNITQNESKIGNGYDAGLIYFIDILQS